MLISAMGTSLVRIQQQLIEKASLEKENRASSPFAGGH